MANTKSKTLLLVLRARHVVLANSQKTIQPHVISVLPESIKRLMRPQNIRASSVILARNLSAGRARVMIAMLASTNMRMLRTMRAANFVHQDLNLLVCKTLAQCAMWENISMRTAPSQLNAPTVQQGSITQTLPTPANHASWASINTRVPRCPQVAHFVPLALAMRTQLCLAMPVPRACTKKRTHSSTFRARIALPEKSLLTQSRLA